MGKSWTHTEPLTDQNNPPKLMVWIMDYPECSYDDAGNKVPDTEQSFVVCKPEWDENEEWPFNGNWVPGETVAEFYQKNEAVEFIRDYKED